MLEDQVRELREGRCWSQAHLADAAGLNVRTVQRIEAGEPCSFETMMALAAALGVDVAVLQHQACSKPRSSSGARMGVEVLCLLPLLLFILVNLLRSVLRVSAPYDALASIGGKFMSVETFNLISPVIFIFGALAALLLSASNFLGVRTKKDGNTLRITALELTSDWTAILVAVAAFICLTALLSYTALEQLFTLL
jgi:transcriptional regulator with XRE-family HTH domain